MNAAIHFWVLLLISFVACLSSVGLFADSSQKKAIFAGGCFWCMESPFDKIDGVIATTSGYTGGSAKNANYKAVSRGKSKHYEAIEVTYLPSKVSYQDLLDIFWINIDPLDHRGQFCDKGSQYLSGIFVADDNERKLAENSLKKLQENKQFSGKIATQIIQAQPFYAAEEYHQDFYLKNPLRYFSYRKGCGRDRRLRELWGKQTH